MNILILDFERGVDVWLFFFLLSKFKYTYYTSTHLLTCEIFY